ncbi:hypothetical protein AXG93_3810s1330 [Marchantia polymorpha subsp. ruderalis]|uniref:Uncharacterized protein n=1 Tax=Marchantia polymorpha subsp. ruderalis TaxID=1480154 RepID=A0A176VE43_MARPO|nr:hypothetical protein AXG93_3810s1330 [Marchantia polymorpha subsp. ruderalis]
MKSKTLKLQRPTAAKCIIKELVLLLQVLESPDFSHKPLIVLISIPPAGQVVSLIVFQQVGEMRIPDFEHRFPKAQLNPLTAECMDISHDWMVSLGIDKELDPILEVKMGAFMSGVRELWLEYIKDMPAECTSRQAEVFVDRIIEHKRANRLPDSLFYGEDMQNLLAACSDIVCWHNDIFSFQRAKVLKCLRRYGDFGGRIPQTSDFGEGILALEQRSCGAHIFAINSRMELKFGGAVGLSRPRMLANFQPQSLDLKLLKKLAAQCSRFRIGFQIKVRVGSAGW